MFALDHYNYARSLTVHVDDLISLENSSPLKHAKFITESKAAILLGGWLAVLKELDF